MGQGTKAGVVGYNFKAVVSIGKQFLSLVQPQFKKVSHYGLAAVLLEDLAKVYLAVAYALGYVVKV